MKVGDKVIVVSFNGSRNPNEKVWDSENYWKLIGLEGEIVQSPYEKGMYASFSKDKKLLVQFPDDLNLLGLEAHNEVSNSLWLLESDLHEQQSSR